MLSVQSLLFLHSLLLDCIKLGGNYRNLLLQYRELLHFGTLCVCVMVTTINTGFS